MPTKVLIVDDSRIFRNIVEESLADVGDIRVIGSVWNGRKAMELIRANPPDLVTLDVEMPTMDGLETLRAIRIYNHHFRSSPQINASDKAIRPIGVIMLSSLTAKGADITIKALEMGAFDFITKPQGKNLKANIEILKHQLLIKIRHFTVRNSTLTIPKRSSRLISTHLSVSKPATTPPRSTRRVIQAVVIGVSTGGPRALASLLPPLCEQIQTPIFIVQHMPPTFTQSLAKSLDAKCRFTVIEGKTDDIVRNHYVYIAPGGRHLLIRNKNNKIYTIVNDQEPEQGYRPSVNVLFRSAAAVFGGNSIAIILTGMGSDGTNGAGILKRAGASVIIQDKDTSVVWGMPGSAHASGYADKMLPLEKIPQAVIALTKSLAKPSLNK